MTLSPAFRRVAPSSASGPAWANGSPPEKVTPSMPSRDMIVLASVGTRAWVAGEKGWNCGLKHPSQRRGHPCTQRTARMPGPFTSDRARNPARLSTLIGRHPGSLFGFTIFSPRRVLAEKFFRCGDGPIYEVLPRYSRNEDSPAGTCNFKHTYRIRSDYTRRIFPFL